MSTSAVWGPASTPCPCMPMPLVAPASLTSSRQRFRCESTVPKTDPITTIPRLFGTDGVRGTAGRFPLDHQTVRRLGAALVRALPSGSAPPRLLVGRDTRESGPWIEAELARGASGEGAVVTSAGIVPTPAVAYLTRSAGYDLGIVISASHNPFQDNGIKVFSGRGEKFDEARETQIEALIHDPAFTVDASREAMVEQEDLVTAYLGHAHEVLPNPARFVGARIAVDCANGATTT